MSGKRIYRSRDHRMIAGVAGGIAEYLNVDPTIVRLIWLLTLLPGGVPGLVLYALCWIIIPEEPAYGYQDQIDQPGRSTALPSSTTTGAETRSTMGDLPPARVDDDRPAPPADRL